MVRAGRWGVVAVALSVAAGGLIYWGADLILGPPLSRARDAYSRGDFRGAAAFARRQLERKKFDPEADRWLARSLARAGDGPGALAAFRVLPPGDLTSEDLYLIGQSLRKGGRAVLGWAALDTATVLDPKNREAAAAAAELHSSAGAAGSAVRGADLLGAIPSPAARVALIVGLLTFERPGRPGGFESLLDRVLQRDRATLARLDTAAAADRLLARVLLEEGRPGEAGERLNPLLGAGNDPEADWLRSRVALGDGNAAVAGTLRERAGPSYQPRPMDREPCRFVGAKRCAECHGTIYKAQQSGRHAATLVRDEGLASIPLPAGPVTDPEDPRVAHRFEREGSRVRVETRVGPDVYRAVVAYALGSAHHGQTLLARDPAGAYRSLRISYYAAGDHWGLTSGFDPHPKAPERFLGEALSGEIYRACIDCHATDFRSDAANPGPEAADKGIGCEKCHGPGANHLRAVETGFPELAIARPKVATPRDRLALCNRCHGADGSIPPSDPRFIRFQSTTLPYSRCFTETRGRLDCVACHDPHRDVETRAEAYEARCLACHTGGTPGPTRPALRFEPVAAGACPVNPRDGCLKCHMPKVENVLPFTTFTDHHIRVRRELGVAAAGNP